LEQFFSVLELSPEILEQHFLSWNNFFSVGKTLVGLGTIFFTLGTLLQRLGTIFLQKDSFFWLLELFFRL
jgi:hypothetical protein